MYIVTVHDEYYYTFLHIGKQQCWDEKGKEEKLPVYKATDNYSSVVVPYRPGKRLPPILAVCSFSGFSV